MDLRHRSIGVELTCAAPAILRLYPAFWLLQYSINDNYRIFKGVKTFFHFFHYLTKSMCSGCTCNFRKINHAILNTIRRYSIFFWRIVAGPIAMIGKTLKEKVVTASLMLPMGVSIFQRRNAEHS